MTPDDYRALRKTVTTPAGEFAYLDIGEGPVAVFVPGLFVSAYLWRTVIDELSAERRCVAYNLPDHSGGSVGDDQPMDLDAQVDMFAGFCDALGIDTFDLVANDTGGAIAQGFAVRHPQRVRTLTLTNCELKDWMPSHDAYAQLIANAARDGMLAAGLKAAYDDLAAARTSTLPLTYQHLDRTSDDELRALMEPHQATLENAQKLQSIMVQLAPDQLEALIPGLRELTVPTKLVWGTGDTIFPLHLAEWFRDTMPCAEQDIELVDGGLLFWPFERGEELAPHLRAHWERHVPHGAAR